MSKYLKILLSGLIVFVITGCSYHSSTNQGSIGVKRKQFMMLPSSQVNDGAKLAYTKILDDSNKKYTLNKDKKTLKKLQNILSRLVPHTVIFKPDALSWKWEVNLIESEQLNAWCMPGGKIAFYSGIIKKLKLSDDQIAAIMGHEMSHALREHSREQVSRQQATQMTITLAAVLLDLDNSVSKIGNQVANVTLNLPNSREAEREADRMGVELAARAGYDPSAAIAVWSKMAKLSKSNPIEVLSTHPIHTNRITDLKRYVQIVDPLYIKALKK